MKDKKFVDLHSHTFYSDGLDTPASLVRNAVMKGTQVFALTDHDTMSGYEEAKAEADKWGLTFIAGVEVTTTDYHILGLNVNPDDKDFQEFLAESQRIQAEGSRKRIEVLRRHGVPISFEKLKKAFPESRLGRYNIAMTMLADLECRAYLALNHPGKPIDEIFKIYLGKPDGIAGKIAKDRSISALEAITAIHSAGGIAIIAHPFKEVKDIERELGKLREEGIDGLEIQPNYRDKNVPFAEYALKHGMKVTYGSDYHGASFSRKLLGREHNNLLNIEELFEREYVC